MVQVLWSLFNYHLSVIVCFRDRDCNKENASYVGNEHPQDVERDASVENLVVSGKAKKRKSAKHADEKVNKKKPRKEPEVNLEDDLEPEVNLLDNSAPISPASILMSSA